MSEPHVKGRSYICDAVLGKKQPYANVQGHAADISEPQTGSGNWPIQIAVGAAINREPQGQDLGPFLRGENGWGLNGTEHGSSIYEGWNVASIVALIHKAPDYKKKGKKRDDALRWIKAEIAKYCLSLKTWPSRSILYVEGEGDHKPSPIGENDLACEGKDGWSYPTDKEYKTRYYAVMPGSRQIERSSRHDSSRPQESTVFVDRNQVTPLISWALGFRRRFSGKPARSRNGTAWCVWLVEQAIGRKYEDAADPATFGLTEDDVSTFKRFLADRRDPSLLLPYLKGYGSCKKQECHWIQLKNGDLVAWNNKTTHSSTTGCTLAWTQGDKVFWASPQSTLRDSRSAKCRREGGMFIVSASGAKLKNSPVERKFILFEEADPLWEVAWTSSGFEIVGQTDGGGRDEGGDGGDGGGGGGDGAGITEALKLIHEAIPGAPLEDQARTGAEVLRLTVVGDQPAALGGATTLVTNLEKARPASPSEEPTDARIERAMGLIDEAVRGAPLEDQARTGAEVLRLTLVGDQPAALRGARTLVTKLS